MKHATLRALTNNFKMPRSGYKFAAASQLKMAEYSGLSGLDLSG